MNNKKSFGLTIVLFIIIIFLSLVVVFLLFYKQVFNFSQQNDQGNNTEQSFCTADVKQCPDGSYVGRDASNDCKFKACPIDESTSTDSSSGFLPETTSTFSNLEWQDFTQNNVSFKAPKEITGLEFVRLNSWPPKVTIEGGNFTCSLPTSTLQMQNEQTMIAGKRFCKSIVSEGAAGSTYTTYTYTTAFNPEQVVKVEFVVQYPQCLNYDSPQSESCTQEEKDFDLENIVGGIVNSISEPAQAVPVY